MKNKNNIIEVNQLSIGYETKKQKLPVLTNINFSIQKNSLVAVLGENGVGKSTLLKTISKVQPSLEGEILIGAKNLKNYSTQQLAKTFSLVLTEKIPENQLTVFELVALGRQPYTNWIGKLSSKDIEKINTALQLTNIYHLKDKKIEELSDGQLQLSFISRALAQDTEIIILDEPTAHLDIKNSYQLFSLLKNLVIKTQKTIIISTHQVNLALELANNFILLFENQIITGSKKEIIDKKAIHSLFGTDFINFNTKLEIFTLKK